MSPSPRASDYYRIGNRPISEIAYRYSALSFVERNDAVHTGDGDFFVQAAGPVDFELVNFSGGA
jgi:hypothetical protein